MKPKYALIVSFIFFILLLIRVIPEVIDTGYDLRETMFDYPNGIAYAFGIWYWIAQITNITGLGFYPFWFIVSVIFSITLYLFLTTSYKINKSCDKPFFYYALLFILLTGYILPWFAFAHVRHATAVLLLLAAIEKQGFKKYILVLISVLIHNLCAVYFLLVIIGNIKNKYIQILIYTVMGVIIIFRDFILQVMLGLLAYSNYSGDLDEYSFGNDNLLMILRVIVLFGILILSIPKEKKWFLIKYNIFYLFTILFTPFSGRILEFFYPCLLMYIGKKRTISLILLLILLLVESITLYSKFPL